MRNRIRQMREIGGLTLVQLGEAVATDHSHLSNIERGEKEPSVDLLFKIASALGTSVADLLSDLDNPDRLRDEAERRLLAAFRDLGPDFRELGLRQIQLLLRARRGEITEAEMEPPGSRAPDWSPAPPRTIRKTPTSV